MDNKKTFCLAKEGEKIYRVSLNSSKLVEDADGSIVKALIIDKIETYDQKIDFENKKFSCVI